MTSKKPVRRIPLVTCEHGGAGIPARYRRLFAGKASLLRSHRGFDRGALPLARAVARAFGAPCIESRTSRLLVDLNRSQHHPKLFSEVTKQLSPEERDTLLARHYTPHRSLR
jgi:predicted N-formylglutamate amidohydrolase